MKHIDEYRSPDRCRSLIARIRNIATRPWSIMEVCGGQTHGLLRWGIDEELRGVVDLLHGPGCPVCVTPLSAIDFAVELARREGIIVTSFGDMLRVPGSRESLLGARASGGQVRLVYSPLDAVKMAQREAHQHVVFLAVGFETTAPATALAVRQAAQLGLDNFSLLVSHVRVQPAMEMIAASGDCRVDGFLAAGHVCAIAGFTSYQQFVERFQLPVVVTGFEPVDLLRGILRCVELLERGTPLIENAYARSVLADGNRDAAALVNDVYEICDCAWRGIGNVPQGGLRLLPQWSHFDAAQRFSRISLPVLESPACRSGEVLAGKIKPNTCEAFGAPCTPDTPLGAPMVSAEGACAAYYRYARATTS